MIISASRRTDIPALYTDWFFKRLNAGYLLVKNPMNRTQISRIYLSPESVDCFVFWTKNPLPMLEHLEKIREYNYYFHFTITPYDNSIEMNLPEKDLLIDTFRRLSDLIGPERVIWRYDPVFYTDKYDFRFHVECFENFARALSGYTERCMYSFLTVYKKCERNMKHISFARPGNDELIKLSESFASACSSSGISLQTCAENLNLEIYGITRGKCIDDDLISKISGRDISSARDLNQRDSCLCSSSIDIGAYNTCTHRCIYCYANYDHDRAINNYYSHQSESELLSGSLKGNEIIRERRDPAGKDKQLQMFE